MILTTFIARSSDGLLLAENYDDNNQDLLKAKRKIKMFLKTDDRRDDSANLKCIDVDNYILQ